MDYFASFIPKIGKIAPYEEYIKYLETGKICASNGESVVMRGKLKQAKAHLLGDLEETTVIMDYPGMYDNSSSNLTAIIKGFPDFLEFHPSDGSPPFQVYFIHKDLHRLGNKGCIELAISYDYFRPTADDKWYILSSFDNDVYILVNENRRIEAIGPDKAFIEWYLKRYLNI